MSGMSQDMRELLKTLIQATRVPQLECVNVDLAEGSAFFYPRKEGEYLDLERESEGESLISVQLSGLLEMASQVEDESIGFSGIISLPYTCSSLITRALGA